MEDAESLLGGHELGIPNRHTFRQLADFVLDFLPGLHCILVLGLQRPHVTETEAIGLLHDADRTIRADFPQAVESAEKGTTTLEVVDLEKVIPFLTDDGAPIFEHAAIDLERENFVRAVREHVPLFRSDPAFRDERSNRGDHVDRARRDILFRDGLGRDDMGVSAADEVVLSGNILIAFDGMRSRHPGNGIVHTALLQEFGGSSGSDDGHVGVFLFSTIADTHHYTPIGGNVKRSRGLLFQALRLDLLEIGAIL